MSNITYNAMVSLASTLQQIAEQRGINIERSRAEQLLAESCHAWPGDVEWTWPKWLVESSKSLGLRARVAHVSLGQALELVEDGALLAGIPAGGERVTLVVAYDGRFADVIESDAAVPRQTKAADLANYFGQIPEEDDAAIEMQYRWVIVENVELTHDASSVFHDRPLQRLLALLRPERSDIWVVGVFAFFAGVLSLATPIAVESLVNIVAFGRLLQPLVILSLMLFGFLAFASMMRALQTFVVEIIQRRLFARVAADLAYRFPRVRRQALEGSYGPELANRFFDVVTLQKVVAQLLLDGIAIVLATAVGMTVLAFYHPWLLGFDILLLGLVASGVILLGRGAIASGIDESKQKYRLAAWLEDVIRCPLAFKASGGPEFALDRANQITGAYLTCRRKHFRVLFRQLLFILGLQAVAGTALLGFGGWLVIQGQLTLGQLVAAELIVATILASLAKLGKHIEGFYDVVASVDKLGYLFDLEMEPQDGLLAFRPERGIEVRFTDVRHPRGSHWPPGGFSLKVEAGGRVALLGCNSTRSTVLLDMLYGLDAPHGGHIEIDQADPDDLRPDILRRAVAMVRDVEAFAGTIAENVQLARAGVSMTDVRSALDALGLLDEVLRLPDGLETKLVSGGYPLNSTQLRLLLLARGIAARPQLLLIDETLDALGDEALNHACNALLDASQPWTLLVATNRRDVADRFASVVDMRMPSGPRPALPAPTPQLTEPVS